MSFDEKKIEQIIQIQEKLHVTYGRQRKKVAIGIYPLDKITFPITFTSDKPENIRFTPLESDKEMDGKEILEKHPTGKEYAHLLEGQKRYPYFVDAKGDILSMPPVINSNTTGRVDETTKEVFIECSGFDHTVLSKALNMILAALADEGAEIHEITVENKHENKTYTLPEIEPEAMKLDTDFVNRRLGLSCSDADIKKYLATMGIGYENKKALIPCYRYDIIDQSDLVEDIAIAYGFENFTPTIPNVATIGEEAPLEKFKEKLRQMLVGLGLYETKTYNITSSETQTTLMNTNALQPIKLSNSLTKDFDCVRAWVIPSLMNVLRENKRYEYPQNYFDFGRIFKKDKSGKSETGILEQERLAVVLCDKDTDYTSIKQVLDVIFQGLGREYATRAVEHDSFIPGRVGRVSLGKKDIAYVGEIHPQVLVNFELEMPVTALELNITELFELLKDSM